MIYIIHVAAAAGRTPLSDPQRGARPWSPRGDGPGPPWAPLRAQAARQARGFSLAVVRTRWSRCNLCGHDHRNIVSPEELVLIIVIKKKKKNKKILDPYPQKRRASRGWGREKSRKRSGRGRDLTEPRVSPADRSAHTKLQKFPSPSL